LIQERIRTLDEAVEMAGFMFRDTVSPAPADLIGQDMTADASQGALRRVQQVILDRERLEVDSLEAELRGLAAELGLKAGQLFTILRIAVTGQRVSPPLIETMVLLGKEQVLERLGRAVELLAAAG
jgi:glutamyl-tRNA synthetase